MATKYINPASKNETATNNPEGSLWHEMKPFVKFGFKVMGIMAGALIAIVKAIPKPGPEKPKSNTRIIHIK